MKTIWILGADGYLGWPTCMHFASRGWKVIAIDNFLKRKHLADKGANSIVPTLTSDKRTEEWNAIAGNTPITHVTMDITSYHDVCKLIKETKPNTIVHYAEQPSAPYSMANAKQCIDTQTNNVIGNLAVLWAIKDHSPETHLVKLGTMGEYGTPNIDIEEGYLDVEHKGRKHTFLYPKTPGSFYHLSKVHDSANLDFACRMWNLKVTDLNQGVVYGTWTPEMELGPNLRTQFYYDGTFGTALNRFCAQAVSEQPITAYGNGSQTRGTLNIRDTLRCVEIAATKTEFPEGRMDIFNQFTESFSVKELATKVESVAKNMGFNTSVTYIDNPRKEAEDHYYNPINDKFLKDYKLDPICLDERVIEKMLKDINHHKDRINISQITPTERWK